MIEITVVPAVNPLERDILEEAEVDRRAVAMTIEETMVATVEMIEGETTGTRGWEDYSRTN